MGSQILALELQGLLDIGFDVSLTGFDIGEVDLILRRRARLEAGSGERRGCDPGAWAEGGHAAGELWQLGQPPADLRRCARSGGYAALMGEERARFVITDPPYNVPDRRPCCGLGKIQHREFAMASGEMSPAEFTGS